MQKPTYLNRVLILEDQAIIAMDVEATLTDAGFDVAEVVATCSGALKWLDRHTVDVAVLDVTLQDGSCEAVARRLADLGIPYVVFSASNPTAETVDPIFLNRPWLEKPAPGERVAEAVRNAIEAAQRR